MAATVSHLPTFLSLFSQKLFFSDPHQQPKFKWTAQQQHRPPPRFTLRASSVKKKTSRKVKSNAELCSELLEFLTAAGLPEGHVPSLKELSQNGRKDLANIVRRRGYKLIKELLADPTKTDVYDIADNAVAGIQDAINNSEEIITGQDQKVNNLDENLSSEVSILENDSASLISHPHSKHDDSGCSTVESSADLYNVEGHSEEVDSVDDNDFVLTGVPITENQSSSSEIGPDFNSENQSNMPLEIPTSSSLDVLDDFSLPTTVQVKENKSFGSNNGSDLNSDGRPSVPLESVTGLSSHGKVLDRGQDGKVDNFSEEDSSSTEVAVTEDHSRGQEGKVDNFSVEDSSSTEDAVTEDHSRGQDGKIDNFSEEDSLSTEVAVAEDHSTSEDGKVDSLSDHDSYAPLESPAILSLEEKVAKFMQNGDLDTIEDNDYGVLIENDTEENKGESEFGTTEEVQLRIPTSEHSKNVLDGSDATMALSPRTSATKQPLPSTTVDPSLRDDSSSDEGSISLSDTDFNVQTSEMEDEFDISRLKSMLHQKEMELFQLKEQFEREQYALSMLQTMAETEISRSQKLVAEKDAELLAAEQRLSGLVEVEIQYCGDGEVVEVTGGFNGWHHQIRLDPQPSPTGLRLWSTSVWLYPGTYEIKFIVDGHWKIDPERESITTGTICNNVLRVER